MWPAPGPREHLRDVVCLGCGCACDDIEAVVADGRILEARNACALGSAWFGDGGAPSRALVAGRPATLDEAIARAARVLSDSSRPVVYLAPDISCETQREAAAIADALRGALDSVTSDTAGAAMLASQERGRPTATLGEIRHRADVIVFWGVDPADRYPRFSSRYAPDCEGRHVPGGRRARTVVSVDLGRARGAADADLRVAVPPEDEVAVLTALAALVEERASAAAPSDPPNRDREAAAPGTRPGRIELAWSLARRLAPTLAAGRYVALVADGEPPPATPDARRAAALIGLADALNGPTRCALMILRAGGNRSGADWVLTAQTGYPMAVDFARGFPRYRPHDGTASARLRHGRADVVAVVGAVAALPAESTAAIARCRSIAVGPRASESPLAGGEVAIDTAVAGIHEPGTALRMDEVPLPLRPVLAGPPPAADVVRALRAAIFQRR